MTALLTAARTVRSGGITSEESQWLARQALGRTRTLSPQTRRDVEAVLTLLADDFEPGAEAPLQRLLGSVEVHVDTRTKVDVAALGVTVRVDTRTKVDVEVSAGWLAGLRAFWAGLFG